jgi:Holliday junction DNA helicase RuvB
VAGNIGDPHQLVSLLCRLPEGQFVFIDEIHSLAHACEECLYPALEDGVVHLVLREGARNRALCVRLEPFTLIGATTRPGALSEPFRARFRLRERLEPYAEEELAEVVVTAGARLGTAPSSEAAREVARRARGTPREAIRILERARDVAQLAAAPGIDVAHVVHAAARLGIDEHGLDPVDRRAVKLLLRLGRPVGVDALTAKLGVDIETFRQVHEPWLERSGLLERTERGRTATEKAREVYGERRLQRQLRWRSDRRDFPGRSGEPGFPDRMRPGS